MNMVGISQRAFSRLKVGQVVSISRKITQNDIDTFTKLSGDTNPIHSSGGKETALVHGAFLNALVSAVIGTKLPGPGTIVVQQTLNFPNKCYADESVTVKVKLADLRKIITVDFSCEVEEQNKVVLHGQAKLIHK
ncbi:unnamed protein product [Acanthoscelides obtectus]|uniref:MaoC-like domain-containing protein n=1 Tax=Acanthoscelides obtectus TaxID=200917 RepID=A0A9P0LLV5_ACAOB|nr:unnamed protein product [Acanthoscelides obtectus]CAK1677459.1 Hydroxyacyl-thioester dehydratase type 2, mitochondrial [Acanthoscelides obtectus]